MRDLSERRTAYEILRIVEALAKRVVAQSSPAVHYGVVFGEPDTAARKVAVRLQGRPEPSAGFAYGAPVPRDGDFVQVEIRPGGDRFVRMVLGRDVPHLVEMPTDVQATGGLTLTNAEVDVPGTTLIYTAATAEIVLVQVSLDMEWTTASAGVTAIARLYVDGVLNSREAVMGGGSVTRAALSQRWRLSLARGTHTLTLRALKSAATGVALVNGPGTALLVHRYVA